MMPSFGEKTQRARQHLMHGIRPRRRHRGPRTQKAWFCGPPAEVIAGIKSVEAKYPGLENFMIHWAEGLPPQEFKEQLCRFAKEVMPAFKRT